MWRRSSTTRLIVEVLRILHVVVGVLSDPEHDTLMCAAGNNTRRVALWRRRAASSRSEFVIFNYGLVADTKSLMMSCGQG